MRHPFYQYRDETLLKKLFGAHTALAHPSGWLLLMDNLLDRDEDLRENWSSTWRLNYLSALKVMFGDDFKSTMWMDSGPVNSYDKLLVELNVGQGWADSVFPITDIREHPSITEEEKEGYRRSEKLSKNETFED